MKIQLKRYAQQLFADQITPIRIYLNIRDMFPGSVLLESAEIDDKNNSRSIICAKPVGGIQLTAYELITWHHQQKNTRPVLEMGNIREELSAFFNQYELSGDGDGINGFFGFQSFEAIRYFESPKAALCPLSDPHVPLLDYRLFQYVICFNHFNGEVTFIENADAGTASTLPEFIKKVMAGQSSTYPFQLISEETSNRTDAEFMSMVEQGRSHCRRGDVFQMVLSRRFKRGYRGDEFNVYRALRHINPSPYMFYFDYGAFKIFGSSPESQINISQGTVTINPIAGTYRRTGDPEKDLQLEIALLEDQKELAEHAMLVDLARNDLNRHCEGVEVAAYKTIQKFSHVMHIVSKVKGQLANPDRYIEVLADTFPAGTLSGAPKVRAIQLLAEIEQDPRSFYGGSIGFIDFKKNVHQAIIIRSFLARNNEIHYRAGAGVVLKSDPATELQEVHNKLGALRKALLEAEKF